MDAHSPPKEKAPLPGRSLTLRNGIDRAGYYAFSIPAIILAGPFWFFEQRRRKYCDRIELAKWNRGEQ